MKEFYFKYKKQLFLSFVGISTIALMILSLTPIIHNSSALKLHIQNQNISFNRIKTTKTIRILTHNNSTSYFLYRGQPMGFHYDLAKALAKKYDWKLEIIVEDDLQKALEMLNDDKADLIAMDITKTKKREKIINFTKTIGYTKQVLVQRRKTRRNNDTTKYISTIRDLNNKDIYIQKGTVFKENLTHIKDNSLVNFNIIEDSIHTMEELVLMTSNGQIDYTACDRRIAAANATYDSRIDYNFDISMEQKLAWAVQNGEDSLLIYVNNWLENFKKSRRFKILENKYFKTKKSSFYTDKTFLPIRGGQLSSYDDIIKKYAKRINWDWRLLAAVIYHESRFNASAISWSGAKGLMQLMPNPAIKFGAENPLDPEQNIRAGTKYLAYLVSKFDNEGISKEEKIKFALAAYNAGLGHIIDARALAKKNNRDINLWTNNVDTFIILKSNPKYYQDPVVKYGYCRGKETYEYVEKIFSLYNNYKNLISE